MGIGLGGFDSALRVAGDRLGLFGAGQDPELPGSSILIQVDGGAGILLRGRAMPHQEVEFGTELRTKKTVYPGNPVATIQVLGFDSTNTIVEGEWKYRFLPGSIVIDGDPSKIETPEQACRLFEDLQRSGRGVRVQWLSIVRRGVLKQFVPRWLRHTDVQWSMEFEWLSANDEEPKTGWLPSSGINLSDLLRTVNLIEDLAALGPDLAHSFAASLVSGIASIRDKVSNLIQVLQTVETLVTLPAAVWGAVTAAVASIRDECTEMQRRLSGPRLTARGAAPGEQEVVTGAMAYSKTPASVTAPKSAGAQQAAFEAWTRSLAAELASLRHQAIMVVTQLQATIRPEATRSHTVRSGESLYSIAAREYGSADFADYLRQANRLQTAMPPAGFQVKIPPRPFGTAADIEITGTVADDVVTITPGDCG